VRDRITVVLILVGMGIMLLSTVILLALLVVVLR
jgi:hypothetical protein